MIRRVGYFLLFLLAFNFIEHFAHQKTDGFSPHRIRFGTKITQGETRAAPELNQPFHYLACGNQCYAFLSHDGKYVLKFFKYAGSPVPKFLTQVPLVNRFKPFRPHRYEKRLWKKERDILGYSLAYRFFQKETALIALHLAPIGHHYPTITITDKLNCSHSINLNETPFVLQQRATPAYKQLKKWMEAGETALAKEGIASLLELLKKRITLHLQDDDVNFGSNFGFIGTDAVQLDPGHFTEGASPDPAKELEKLQAELTAWCHKHAPELL